VNALRSALGELYGLFVEDRTFALATLGWLAVCGVLGFAHVLSPPARGLILFLGLAGILIASTRNAAMKSR
jgi:hypothetical protein